MKIRFKIAWGNYRVGDVIEPAGVLRGHYLGLRLMGRPVCEVVAPAAEPEPEPAQPARTARGRRK